ncbi:MAG: DUF4129 domain-containing protein, partial [Holophaga sp.]|nr:DUF4129 domain-containing protein [Holophaga sp.]
DLGLSLLQDHWKPVAVIWLMQVGLALGLFLPFLWRDPLWCLLGLWWLKPWLDRGVLFVLSRVVFAKPASVWDFLREWRMVHKRGVVAGLLWRRLSPMRSYVLPIFQLEGLGGRAFRARARVLARQGGGMAFLLTLSGWVFTILTFVGFIGLLQALVPPGARTQLWNGFQSISVGFQWFLLVIGMLAFTLTEPFFVAAGFGLYLNRRTQLEGWDIELAFRRLATRLALTLLLLVCALPLSAQEPVPQPVETPTTQEEGTEPAVPLPEKGPFRPEAEARLRAQRIQKEDPAFQRTQEVKKLQYHPTGREPRWVRALLDALFARKESEVPKQTSSSFPEGLGQLIALVGKIVLVGGLLAFLLWLVYRFHHRLTGPTLKEETWEAPEALAGLDIRPESLPPDVPAAARNLFVQGQFRAAMALLYRGALVELVHRRGVEIPASATEGDCLRAATDRLEPGPAERFAILTRTWQHLAYKDEIPSREAFEALCDAWPAAFGGRP